MLILNKIQLTGRVGRISARDFQDKRFVTMRIAVPEKYIKHDQRSEGIWFSVVVNGKAAEFAEKFVGVGDYIFVEGRLKGYEFKDKQGIDRYELQVYASELQIVQKKKTDDGQQAASTPRQETQDNPHLAELLEGQDQDLPF